MRIVPLEQSLVPSVMALMALGEPFIRARGDSDYWLYGRLFSSSCPVAVDGQRVMGAAIAFRSQDEPWVLYVQDLMVDPACRRRGVATALVGELTQRARGWGSRRIFLTSEPDNHAAHATWLRLGFVNVPGDMLVDGIHVVADLKGAGKHRAVYELLV